MTSEYRRGVEDATKPLYSGYPMALVPIEKVNERLAERRKELLTKKVTKWVNFYGSDGDVAYHYNTRETALRARSTNMDYLGTYPVEIEVPVE